MRTAKNFKKPGQKNPPGKNPAILNYGEENRSIKRPAHRKNSGKREVHEGRPENTMDDLRMILKKRREKILQETKDEMAKYIRGDNRQLVDTALDEGDMAVVDLSEDISLRRLSTHRKTILDIEEALRKIDEGTYGLCEECGDQISGERLRIFPAARLCVDCQEKKERFDKFENQPQL